MSRYLPISNFKWVEKTSEFNEDFIKESSYHLHIGMQIIYMHRQCHEICL